MNISAARRVITFAVRLGVRDFVVCAGSRNSPLLAALGSAGGIRTYSFVDERAAAFFALGRAKRDRRPVAVVTTSGTAAAELFPAVVEAWYSGIPLLLITADRPKRYRGSGAPQTIEQRDLFGLYAKCIDIETMDIEASEAASIDAGNWSGTTPLHINLALDEPLIDEPIESWHVEEHEPVRNAETQTLPTDARLDSMLRPLVILGELAAHEREAACSFALRLGAPVVAEPLSGLRGDVRLAALEIRSGERFASRGRFDGVIRIGGVPTVRFWRDLDETRTEIPVVSISALPFSGLASGHPHRVHLQGDVAEILASFSIVPREIDRGLRTLDETMAAGLDAILDDELRSELAMVRALSRQMPERARIFLGNSLPVREWDLAATREPRRFSFHANRGANGIDGELSTFFGLCDSDAPNWCLLGDLTTLYDLNAPWIVSQLERGVPFVIVIINNGGGRIFSRVASLAPLGAAARERIIENTHALRFEHWAAMWNLDYVALDAIPDALPRNQRLVIELLPDSDVSRRAWDRYDAALEREVIWAFHGFLGRAADWNDLAGRLHHELRAFDFFRRTDAEELRAGDSPERIADSIARDDSSPVLLGYSLGGRLALHTLLGLRARGIAAPAIIVSAGLGVIGADERRVRRDADERWAARFERDDWNDVIRDWNAQPLFGGEMFGGEKKSLPRIESDFDRNALAEALRSWSPAVLEPLHDRLRELDSPLLWIAGERDTKYVAEAQRAAEQLRNGELWICEESGHRVPWEQPESFAGRVARFLTKLRPGETDG